MQDKFLKSKENSPMNVDNIPLFEYYEIENTLKAIQCRQAKRVTLQFPDELLADSFYVFNELSKYVDKDCQLYVLGDTSYSPCCVDVVAASHVDSDLIIHYGDACISIVDNIPIYYVFGKTNLDVDTLISTFSEITFKLHGLVYLCYEPIYESYIPSIVSQLQEQYSEIQIGILPHTQNWSSPCHCNDNIQNNQETIENTISIPCVFNNKSITDIQKSYIHLGSTLFHSYSYETNPFILYIGRNNKAYQTLSMECALSTVYRFDEDYYCWKNENKARKELMIHYNYSERAKESNVFAIVVGTLSNTLESNDKICYVLSVGKINFPKLANIPGIDCYILVGCPRSIFIDEELRDLLIITPFDLDIAFNNRQWTGEYIPDYSYIYFNSIYSNISDDDKEIKHKKQEIKEKEEKNKEELIHIHTASELVEFHSFALDYIHEKQFTGLTQNENAKVQSIKEGQKGIAWEYTDEVEDELY
ncbi:hypothetical protein WA158_000384 [Blastocystis sp. Blastoise]